MFLFEHEMNRLEKPLQDNPYNNLPYFHWKEAFKDPLLLEFVDKYEHQWKPAEVGVSAEKASVNTEIRDHEVSLIEYNVMTEGLFRALYKIVESVNYYHYNFRLWSMEDIQTTRYNEGSFFVMHNDRSVFPHTIERKLTVIVGLSGQEDYQGGDIVVCPSGNEKFKHTVRLNKGDVLVFPCWVPYEIQPVTQASMTLLQTWMYGPKFV